MALKLKSHSVDQYGVKNYSTTFLLLISLVILYSCIGLLSFVLLHFEDMAPNSNIHSLKDAFWTLQMSASTIGFGDFYPVTFGGRMTVALMFYLGVGMVGFIGAQFISHFTSFSDTNIKNRELRQQNKELHLQNQEIIAQGKAVEIKVEQIFQQLTQKN
jgi:voltage-gated potassium channel